jgi:hypothetical protein
MSTKKNILQEAIADSKALKAVAIQNARNLVLESLKEDLKEMVEDQMNEMADVADYEQPGDMEDEAGAVTSEGNEMDETDDFELEGEVDDFGDEGEEDEGEEAGFSADELQEALASALNEVDHAGLGEMEEIDPGSHPTGLMDQDSKEDGWENKEAPAAKSWAVKEGLYKRKVASLVAENATLKKVNLNLRKSVNEVNLFNTKLHYAHKLLNKEGLDVRTKKAIVAKMDNVRTVSEAKTLFESLELALGSLSENRKPAPKQKSASLSEALGVHGRAEGKNLTEAHSPHLTGEQGAFDPARLKKLAGMK